MVIAITSGHTQIRCRIIGTYKGNPFEYVDPEDSKGSQFIHSNGNDPPDPSYFWWSEGNFSCDCNRDQFLPEEWRESVSGCGETILIDRIEPIEEGLPVLVLNETVNGHA